MESRLVLNEVVKNKDRRYGSAAKYYPCKVVFPNGEEKDALFTITQIGVATERAGRNPEDVPEENLTFWEKLFAELRGE